MIIHQIVALLRLETPPDAPQEWKNKLPDIARRLEDSLYRFGTSKHEYMDLQTLKHRLKDVAIKHGGAPHPVFGRICL